MTTNEVIQTLNSRIADLDAQLATGVPGSERQSLQSRLVRLYNARNRLPLLRRERVA